MDRIGLNSAASDDFDPVLTRGGLNSSLTGGHPGREAGRCDRWWFWWKDPNNKHTVRVIQCVVLSLLLVVAILVIAAVTKGRDDASTIYSIRLPPSPTPVQYTMDLDASLVTAKFSGNMMIQLFFPTASAQILLHQVDLTLGEIWASSDGGTTQVEPSSAFDTGQWDLFAINFDQEFAAGSTVLLRLRFVGTIEPTLAGFYLSHYNTSAGARRTIASTQFEATDARRAFPCFDEPDRKANFTISITTDDVLDGRKMGVLSNMPMTTPLPVPTAPTSGRSKWQFMSTPRMSTYLVAYCITDFESKSTRTSRGLPITVWAASDKIGQVDVALRAANASIQQYEAYFNQSFPLPKLDQIAIPNFAAGAMENWGLVTYRETALLIDPNATEAMSEQNVVATVAHELAHQWFGDIVTMVWWDDLWLNEGFASYVEWLGIASYVTGSQPKWDVEGQMVADAQTTALALDSSQYSHPIVQPVQDPSEIDALFDMISYDKGCSVLRMLGEVLAPTFQIGLHNYLVQHAYGNAASEDLWETLQAASSSLGLPVSVPDFMHKWTRQLGYPVVTLTANPSSTDFGLIATQQRFLELPKHRQDPALVDTQAQYAWDIRLTMRNQAVPLPNMWFLVGQAAGGGGVPLPFAETDEFLHLNIGRFDFFRVNYPSQMWGTLAAALAKDDDRFSYSDRVGLIDDVWTLALAGQTTYTNAFQVVDFLSLDNYADYTPWIAALAQFGRVARLLNEQHPDTAAVFNRYITGSLIHNNTFSQAPWSGFTNNHLWNLLQASFVSTLVAYNDTAARIEASRLFFDFMTNDVEVPVDVRDAVYRVGIEGGDEATWMFLYARYTQTQDASEARRILRALTRTFDPVLLRRLLAWSLDTDKVKSQDTSRIVIYVAQNAHQGKAIAWEWIQTAYPELFKRFGSQSFTLSELLTRVIGLFQTQGELASARAFFAGKDLGTAKRAVSQAYEAVQTNIYWLEERYAEFAAALAVAVADNPPPTV